VDNPQITAIRQQPLWTPAECEAIVARSAGLPWQRARINAGDSAPDARDTEECSLATAAHSVLGQQALHSLLGALQQANRRCWQAHLSGDLELNLLRYTDGAHYRRWHSDLFEEACTRKVSFTVQLSPADSYLGGALEFVESAAPASRQQGDLIVFPSFAVHRVAPVTEGVRIALVGWLHGPSFR